MGPSLSTPGPRSCVSMARQLSAVGIFGDPHCPGAHADWMSALCPRLWDVPLHQLSIPGEGGAGRSGECVCVRACVRV